MKLAIMQPYFFPYIGYFQLIQAVDKFVVYDDVNYIKAGWINRNNILAEDESQRITLETQGASQNRLINQVAVGANVKKLARTIEHRYSHAPYFKQVFPIIEEILLQNEKDLTKFLVYGLQRLSDVLGIHTEWIISSTLEKDSNLRGEDKILAICEELGATQYINMPGGKALYKRENFEAKDIHLSFIEPRAITYQQFSKDFVPNLSIIDVMMFNDFDRCRVLLTEYDFV